MTMMQQDIAIKQCGVDDAALLQKIATQAYAEHYADTWYDGGDWYLQTYLSERRFQEELQDSNARFLLIYYKDTAAGFLKLNQNKPLVGGEQKALELERIYLAESMSGKGVGTFLVQWIFEFAQKDQYKIIWLKVMDTNPDAVRFYQKMGFEICGTHQVDFVQKKEGMRGMYIMEKRF